MSDDLLEALANGYMEPVQRLPCDCLIRTTLYAILK